jgi:hypothetical protein
LKASLAGRGQDVSKLVMHLFKVYKQIPDQSINRYIEAIRDRYDADLEDTTAENLMHLTVNKFDLLAQRKAMPTDNVEKMVALSTTTVQDARSSPRNQRARSQDAWKKIPPKTGEPTTKVVDKKSYIFCPEHKAWCIHTINKCTLRLEKDSSTSLSSETKEKQILDNKLIINRAYHAAIHGLNDDDDKTD